MSTYAIGDLQGCDSRLGALLDHIETTENDAASAEYIFVGDIVNRGPESLQTLRRLKALGSRARFVLGNHDIHLLAASQGIRPIKPGDTLEPILAAPDRNELIEWLRHQPLARLEQGYLVVHAGVVPQWSVAQTLSLAGEVEQALQGPDWVEFLRHSFGNQPDRWRDDLEGFDRLRLIVNVLTRIRLCRPDGTTVLKNDGTANTETAPWFDMPQRGTADTTIVFGHWSARGLQLRPNLIGLDTGCVWGGKLTAVRLEDRALFQVDCPQYRKPGAPA